MAIDIAIPIIVAVVALIGALGSQYLTSRAAERRQRIELFFTRKSTAYESLVRIAASFSFDPLNHAKHDQSVAAVEGAYLLGSTGVRETLEGEKGVFKCAHHLRIETDDNQRETFRHEEWMPAFHRMSEAMARDLDWISEK